MSASPPDLETLAREAEAAFPDCTVQRFTPMAAPPFVAVRDGAFAAVFLRPEGEVLRLKPGVPPTGLAGLLGFLAPLVGRGRRTKLWERVRHWVDDRGWPAQAG